MKKRRFWRQVVALGLSVVLAIGCGLPAVKAQDSMEASVKSKAYAGMALKSPKLSASSVSLKTGETKKIRLKNTTESKKITWSTSKKKVASIKASGAKVTITAKKAGTAAVTASYCGKKYKCTVTVQAKEKTKALPYRSLGVSDFTSAGKEKVGQWYFTEKWENNGAQGGGWVLRYSKKKGKEGTVIVRNYAGAVTNGTLLYYGVSTGENRFESNNLKLKVYRYNLSNGKCREVATIPYANQLEGLYNGKYYASRWPTGEGWGWGESYVYDPKTKLVSRLYDAVMRGSYRNYMIISEAGDTVSPRELIVYNVKTKKFSTIEQAIKINGCRVVGRYVYYIAQSYDTGKEYLQFYRYDLLTGTRKLLSPEKFIFTYDGCITEWTEEHADYYQNESGNISRIVFQ